MTDLLHQPVRSVAVAVLDLEMTGLDPTRDRVCEVAIVRADGAHVVAEWGALVRPAVRMTASAFRVHGISDEMVAAAPPFADLADDVQELLTGCVVIAHNVTHDLEFLHREFELGQRDLPPPVAIDTLLMARRLFAFRRNNLPSACEELGVPVEGLHRALADARTTWLLWRRMIEILDPDGTVTVGELIDLVGALAPNSPLRLHQQRQLRDAFRHQRTVWIDYQSTEAPTHGVTRREIGVWRLKLPYIQAWCYLREGERVFRLDRIRSVAPGDREYEIPKFDPRI